MVFAFLEALRYISCIVVALAIIIVISGPEELSKRIRSFLERHVIICMILYVFLFIGLIIVCFNIVQE